MENGINDVLIECVKACGGSKAVGPMLWPDLKVDVAQRKLLACLNPDRVERLNPDQVTFVGRKARENGCHALVEFYAVELGYAPPVPVEPRDEVAELQRQFIEAVRSQAALAERIERAAGRVVMRAVA